MQLLHDELVVVNVVEGQRSASRRGLLTGSLRLAGGGALALTLAGSPVLARVVTAQEEDDEDAEGGEVSAAGNVGTSLSVDDAGADAEVPAAAAAPAAAAPSTAAPPAQEDDTATTETTAQPAAPPAAQPPAQQSVGASGTTTAPTTTTLPSTGTGTVLDSDGGRAAGLVGLAAVGAAAAAFLTRRTGVGEHRSEA